MVFISLLFAFLKFICPVVAEISIDAQKISYNSSEGIITAYGEVVITQTEKGVKKRRLTTEKIEYNRKSGKIRLYGKSILREETGEIVKANNIELDDKMKTGIIKALSIVLKDKARIKAMKGEKKEELYSLSEASYSPCYESKNCKFPLWDVYADNAVYDTKNKTIIYHNAKLRIKGQTVLYTPYFSHPSFEVKRKSGFVTPIIHSNNDTGAIVGIPYFFAISDSKNLKITPFVNFKSMGFISGEYSEAFTNGDLTFGASILAKKGKKTRWHINTTYKSYNLDNKRFIIDINRASDVTYLIKYPVNKQYTGSILRRKSLTSKIGVEFFDSNYFFDMKSYLFQTPQRETAPFILPKANFQYDNDTISFSGDVLCLKRDKQDPCDELLRFSNKLGVHKEYISKTGVLFNIKSYGGIDTYHSSFDDSKTKISKSFPILENTAECSYPIYSEIFGGYNSIFAPKISVSSIRTWNKRQKFELNEDSVLGDFNDLNLYELNRYGGIDKLEQKERISCGVEDSIYRGNKRFLNFFIGRSKSENFGRIVVSPSDYLRIRTRFVGIPLINKSEAFEFGSTYKFKKLSFDVSYFGDKRKNKYREFSLSQIGYSAAYQVTQYWSITYSQIFNLQRKAGHKNLSRGIYVRYMDECFEFVIGVYKSKYKEGDLKPKSGLVLAFSFKNLGSLSQSSRKSEYQPIISRALS